MLYYEHIDKEPVKITYKKFVKIYGKNYKLFEKDIKFDDAHCIDDPFAKDVNDTLLPLIDSNYKYLKDHFIDCCYEI